MRTHKPPLSSAATVVGGAGHWLVNVNAQPESGPAAVSLPAAATQPALPQSATRLSSAAEYFGKVLTAGAPVTIDLSVSGGIARAYVCDGYAVETWLSGSVSGDTVGMVSADRTDRLEGRQQGRAVVGTLTLGERSWAFAAPEIADAY